MPLYILFLSVLAIYLVGATLTLAVFTYLTREEYWNISGYMREEHRHIARIIGATWPFSIPLLALGLLSDLIMDKITGDKSG